MATIESVLLDGGECNSVKSVQDMKKDGWLVDDIKIENSTNGNNYIYIFKKENISSSSIDEKKLESRILQRLETRKKEEQLAKKKQVKIRMSRDGKALYIKKCQSCHGEKADEKYGNSRALIDLNFIDYKTTLRDYELGQYDRGSAFVMIPYANAMSSTEVKNTYSYIQSLKPVKKDIEKTDDK